MSVHEDLLVADFQQCFEQMRHYDDAFQHILQFAFGGILVVIGACAALLEQYGLTELTRSAAGLLFAIASGAGFFLLMSLARNRVYFAFVARYVNELRGVYLAQAPGSATNKTGMYVDHRSPRIFNPASSHSFQLYFLSSCNAVLFAAAVTVVWTNLPPGEAGATSTINWVALFISFFLSLLLQVGWVLRYWSHAEKRKTADAAVFRTR